MDSLNKKQKRRLVLLDDRRTPTCRRADCDRVENPTHWVDAEPSRELIELARIARQVVRDFYGMEKLSRVSDAIEALREQLSIVDAVARGRS